LVKERRSKKHEANEARKSLHNQVTMAGKGREGKGREGKGRED